MQVGVQGMSDDSYETANRYIKEGKLGKVVLAQIDYSRNHRTISGPIRWTPTPNPARISIGRRGSDPRRSAPGIRNAISAGAAIGTIRAASRPIFSSTASRASSSRSVSSFPIDGVGTGGKFEFTTSVAEIPDTLNILLDYPEGHDRPIGLVAWRTIPRSTI